MKTPSRANPQASGTISVLSVSPFEEDHLSLQTIVGRSTWTLFKANGVSHALGLLQKHDISVVVCECDLMSRTWVDILKNVEPLPDPPSMIIASRVADERLWAEALNLGAWDVLAKPFEKSEVLRSVKSAWDHRHHRSQISGQRSRLMQAAS